jgi:hypothetical protein
MMQEEITCEPNCKPSETVANRQQRDEVSLHRRDRPRICSLLSESDSDRSEVVDRHETDPAAGAEIEEEELEIGMAQHSPTRKVEISRAVPTF